MDGRDSSTDADRAVGRDGVRDPESTAGAHLSTPLTLAVLGAISVALFAIRLTGRPNLLDNEYRLGACVLDAVQAGNWLCPHDALGDTDKPPMLTWLSAATSLAVGRVNLFTLYLPTALATMGISWLLFTAGRAHFGWRAGFLGALAYLLSDVATKQIATARWDGLFALTVMLGALAAFHAWMAGNGWVWFWLAAAAATLTKGPLGLLLAGLGLCAAVWEWHSGTPHPIRGRQIPGIAVYLLLTLGWFALAYHRVGQHLIENMMGQELIGHIVEHEPGRRFTKPMQTFLGGFAPWSIAAMAGFVRVWVAPAADARVRRFERFLFCWFAGGLLIFTLSPHTASRLLFPLIPASALLAGLSRDDGSACCVPCSRSPPSGAPRPTTEPSVISGRTRRCARRGRSRSSQPRFGDRWARSFH